MEKKPIVYHLKFTNDLEYAKVNKHDHSGVVYTENLNDLGRLIEKIWSPNHFAHTDLLDNKHPSSLLYNYLSQHNTSAFIYMTPTFPYTVLEIDISGLTKNSLEDTLKELGLEYDENVLRIGNIF